MGKAGKYYQKIAEMLEKTRCGEISEEEKEALSEAADIIIDYEAAVAMTANMQKKYETPQEPVRRGYYYQCPICGANIQDMQAHCGRCGKAIRWDRRKHEQGNIDGKADKGSGRKVHKRK